MLHQKVVIVVMPAYNASRTLEATYRELPHDIVDEVILVDDGSRDDTAGHARQLGIHTIIHPKNRGYGGNQKTCYREALSRGGRYRGDGPPGLSILPATGHGDVLHDHIRSL